jgi:hypothetical protein
VTRKAWLPLLEMTLCACSLLAKGYRQKKRDLRVARKKASFPPDATSAGCTRRHVAGNVRERIICARCNGTVNGFADGAVDVVSEDV